MNFQFAPWRRESTEVVLRGGDAEGDSVEVCSQDVVMSDLGHTLLNAGRFGNVPLGYEKFAPFRKEIRGLETSRNSNPS
jgi:hypothetical protein